MWRLSLLSSVAWMALASAPLWADDAEDKATAAVERLGGRVTRSEKLPGNPVVAVTLVHARVTAANLKELAAFKHLASVNLGDSRVADEDLKELAPLTSLTALELKRAGVTDRTLVALREVKQLHALNLAEAPLGERPTEPDDVTSFNLMGTKVTAEGLKELAAFRNLTELNLADTGFTAENLKGLAHLKGLTTLYLSEDTITDQSLASLGAIGLLHALKQADTRRGRRPTKPEDVTEVNLMGTKVTTKGLKHLAAYKNLSVLGLGAPGAGEKGLEAGDLKGLAAFEHLRVFRLPHDQVTDQVLAQMRAINRLHVLDLASGPNGKPPLKSEDVLEFGLSGTKVTGEGLKELAAFRNLTTLELGSMPVTDQTLAALRQANLFHTLTVAGAKGNKRPVKAEDVTSLVLSQTKVTDAGLGELVGLPNLATLNLSGLEVAGPGLKHLAGLPGLTALDLSGTPVTDEELGDIGRCANLVLLNLARTKVTDEGMKELAGLKHLTKLDVNGTRVTGAGVKSLNVPVDMQGRQITDRALATLREGNRLHTLSLAHGSGGKRPTKPGEVTLIDLRGTEVTDAGLKELAALENVTVILLGSRITDKGLRELAAFKKLTTLDLFGTKVTNEGMKDVAELKNLSDLRLFGTKVTAKGLAALAPVKGLTSLHLFGDQVTDQTFTTLRELGKLHTVTMATDPKGKRPVKPEDVTSLNLIGTKVTGVGLKEIAGFKNLTSLQMTPFDVDDGVLAALREVNLLHTLTMATAEKGRRPTKPGEVLSLNLALSKVSDKGLKELAGLKNLEELNLLGSKVTPAGVKSFQEILPMCKVRPERP